MSTRRLERALAAALPPPQVKRSERVLLALTKEERQRLEAVAAKRGEPLAVTVRALALAAAETIAD